VGKKVERKLKSSGKFGYEIDGKMFQIPYNRPDSVLHRESKSQSDASALNVKIIYGFFISVIITSEKKLFIESFA
jgi:hypothetical protein